MRSTFQILVAGHFALLVAGLVGCGSGSLPPAAERLPGKWQGQMIVYEDSVEGKLSPEQISQLAQQQMSLQFAADGQMVTSAEVTIVPSAANSSPICCCESWLICSGVSFPCTESSYTIICPCHLPGNRSAAGGRLPDPQPTSPAMSRAK